MTSVAYLESLPGCNSCEAWVDGPSDGRSNMREDTLLMETSAHCRGLRVRIYDWSEPTVTIGRHQKMSVDSETLPVVRRPTGGRAVLHLPGEVTLAMVGSTEILPSSSPKVSAGALMELLAQSLRSLGIAVERCGKGQYQNHAACFDSSTESDLRLGKYKICGGAMRHSGGSFLMQCSLPMSTDASIMEAAFGAGEWKKGRQRSLTELTGATRKEVLESLLSHMNASAS